MHDDSRPVPAPRATLSVAVVGAGPVGLSLALHAARALPRSRITLFDSRSEQHDIGADPRTLALSFGSVQWLQRLGAWDPAPAQPITEVHVSQQPPTWAWPGREPEVVIRAADEGVPMLGAVLRHGQVVAPLQRAWLAAAAREPQRLHTRFGTPVAALKALPGGAEIDAGIAERFDLVVVAEGGVYSPQASTRLNHNGPPPLEHDYRQTAWVGQVTLDGGRPGVAFERFTRRGPAALLPLRPDPAAPAVLRAALVWCVPSGDDPVRALDAAQRLAVLNTVFHPAVGRLTSITPLKGFPLGLRAERTLVEGRIVRIGNAAQTLHPVAGQGLNLGLRDSVDLVRGLAESGDVDAVLRRLEWQRGPDRWAMIAATDFLARSFTWALPGAGAARGLGLAALQALKPVRSLLARQMMYGRR